MPVHTHVRLLTSRQPARSSATKGPRSAPDLRGSRIGARKAALTAKLAASTANAQAGPADATRTPATTGPARKNEFRVRPSSAFACWIRDGCTVSGTTPVIAGWKKASPAP